MDIIFLDQKNPSEALVLKPERDTVYVLPKKGTRLDLFMEKAGVRAFLFGLFTTTRGEHFTINQKHRAPATESHVFLKTLVEEKGNFAYNGNLHIEGAALHARASQEARGLLLGEESAFQAVPSLEIFPAEVTCQHKASAAPVSADALFALQARGVSRSEGLALLEKAFLESGFDVLSEWGLSREEQEKVRVPFS